MNKHKCVLCLGTNFDPSNSIQESRRQILSVFPDTRFSEELITEAIGEGLLSPFINQVALFSTPLPAEEITRICKDIEHQMGRNPQDKAKGIIKIDIDILMVDDTILKPQDLERDFVQKGIQKLQS